MFESTASIIVRFYIWLYSESRVLFNKYTEVHLQITIWKSEVLCNPLLRVYESTTA